MAFLTPLNTNCITYTCCSYISAFTTTVCYAVYEITSIIWTMRFSWLENAYSCQLFLTGNYDHKVRLTGLVFGVWSRITSRSVHTILQVSVCMQWLRFVAPWLTSRQTAFDQLIWTDQPAELKMSAQNSVIKKAWQIKHSSDSEINY